jgi:hypothetical protein
MFKIPVTGQLYQRNERMPPVCDITRPSTTGLIKIHVIRNFLPNNINCLMFVM